MNLRLSLAAIALAGLVHAQENSTFANSVDGTLTVGLPGKSPRFLERADIDKLRHVHFRAKDPGGKTAVYSGVLLKDLLENLGFSFARERTDSILGSYIVVQTVSDRRALFSLTELDAAVTGKHVVFADAKNGKPMTSPEGPFRIVIPEEKEPVRWLQQVWAVFVVEDNWRARAP
jgi:hypothetical protein